MKTLHNKDLSYSSYLNNEQIGNLLRSKLQIAATHTHTHTIFQSCYPDQTILM